jgi:hypothetical protein
MRHCRLHRLRNLIEESACASVIDSIHASLILNAFDIALLLANDLDLGSIN